MAEALTPLWRLIPNIDVSLSKYLPELADRMEKGGEEGAASSPTFDVAPAVRQHRQQSQEGRGATPRHADEQATPAGVRRWRLFGVTCLPTTADILGNPSVGMIRELEGIEKNVKHGVRK